MTFPGSKMILHTAGAVDDIQQQRCTSCGILLRGRADAVAHREGQVVAMSETGNVQMVLSEPKIAEGIIQPCTVVS